MAKQLTEYEPNCTSPPAAPIKRWTKYANRMPQTRREHKEVIKNYDLSALLCTNCLRCFCLFHTIIVCGTCCFFCIVSDRRIHKQCDNEAFIIGGNCTKVEFLIRDSVRCRCFTSVPHTI